MRNAYWVLGLSLLAISVAVAINTTKSAVPQWGKSAYVQRLSNEAWESYVNEMSPSSQRAIRENLDDHKREYGHFLATVCTRILRDAGFKEGRFLSLPIELRTSLREVVTSRFDPSETWPANEHTIIVRLERSYQGTIQIIFTVDLQKIAVVDTFVM